MQLLKQDVQMSRFHQGFYQKNQGKIAGQQFVPFVKERDSMGRLIKMQYAGIQSTNCGQSSANSPKIVKISRKKSEGQIEQKMSKYFKHSNIFAQRQSSKHKGSKRTFIQIINENPIPRKREVSQKKDTFVRSSTANTISITRFIKTASCGFGRSSPKAAQGIARSTSTILKRGVSQHTQMRVSSPQHAQRRTSYYEPQIKIQQNLNNYPEMNRMRKMKELEVKIHSDFQENHGRFLNKMIKSKQLAFQLKVNLDKIDGYF